MHYRRDLNVEQFSALQRGLPQDGIDRVNGDPACCHLIPSRRPWSTRNIHSRSNLTLGSSLASTAKTTLEIRFATHFHIIYGPCFHSIENCSHRAAFSLPDRKSSPHLFEGEDRNLFQPSFGRKARINSYMDTKHVTLRKENVFSMNASAFLLSRLLNEVIAS